MHSKPVSKVHCLLEANSDQCVIKEIKAATKVDTIAVTVYLLFPFLKLRYNVNLIADLSFPCCAFKVCLTTTTWQKRLLTDYCKKSASDLFLVLNSLFVPPLCCNLSYHTTIYLTGASTVKQCQIRSWPFVWMARVTRFFKASVNCCSIYPLLSTTSFFYSFISILNKTKTAAVLDRLYSWLVVQVQ